MHPTSERRLNRCRLGLAALATLTVACSREPWRGELPLRPLLYTEPAQLGSGEGSTEPVTWTDPVAWPSEFGTQTSLARPTDQRLLPARSPEALVLATTTALLAHDREALEFHLFDAAGLTRAARTGADTARRDAATLLDDSLRTLALFDPGPPSQAREGGLGAMLRPGQLVIGRPRTVEGAVIEDGTPAVMHWGSEIELALTDGTASFTLRFPRIIVDTDGTWRLGAAPTVDARFAAFRELGIDRKPQLLAPEHSPLPLSVGNFWHYRTRRPSGTETADTWGILTQEGFRDEVTDVTEFDGWRLVRMRRVFDNPLRPVEATALIQTPLRLYRCDRECQRHAGDLGWILSYSIAQVPVVVYPLSGGRAWGAGGVDSRNNVYRVQPESTPVETPAGAFGDTTEIVRITPRGRESRFFVPGVGFILSRNDAGLATTLEELTEYRVLP